MISWIVFLMIVFPVVFLTFAFGEWSGAEKERTKKKKPEPKWGRDDENNSK